jgi:small ligand-binding sensory domain FIST
MRMLVLLAGVLISGEPAGADVASFFKDCPSRGRIRLHEETNPWDAHGLLYTAAGIGELEVLRIADWLVDLPLPGPTLRPFRRSVRAVRRAYHRLPRARPIARFGELVDALQIPEVSLGDASALYSVATGGAAGPGSGLVIRLHKLIDWTQHIAGDVNALLGWPVGRPRGLVRWSGPARVVDGLQRGLLGTLNAVQVFAARVLEGAVTGLELGAEGLVNLGHRRAHADTTVFLHAGGVCEFDPRGALARARGAGRQGLGGHRALARRAGRDGADDERARHRARPGGPAPPRGAGGVGAGAAGWRRLTIADTASKLSGGMKFTSGLSDAVSLPAALEAACAQVTEQLAGSPCHLACVFVSPIYRASWAEALADIHRRLTPDALIGCSGSGIIGGGQEVEWVPALSIVGASLPGVRLFPFRVEPDELEVSGPGGFWIDKIGVAPRERPVFVLCADPFTCDADRLLRELNQTYASRPIIGGLVSGGQAAGEHLLFRGAEVCHDGAVGVALTGNIEMDTIVSQGCRPVGRPYVVTRAEENVIFELGGRQAVVVLHEVLSSLSRSDRELAQQGAIFAGLVINEMRHRFASGDFLIRNIVGLDPESGALAIGERVQAGQTLQFHLRDAATSRQELRRLLGRWGQSRQVPTAAGCLLFNCTGRGKGLYGTSHHDVRTIQMLGGKLPIGGFFSNGEIGPVGGTNFLHGYTASLGLFRPLGSADPNRQVAS